MNLLFKLLFLLPTLLLLSACSYLQPANMDLILATTTSTQDSGLLDVLIPAFEAQTGYKVKVIAVGSGQALQMGREGNADVLLVHAPAAERDYMAEGFGAERKLVMHNDFVILGPSKDPAGIRGFTTAVNAFQQIAASGAVFISRGDDSGTHKMELALWAKTGLKPGGESYLETGQGMAATLIIASEKEGYTLSDRASYLANQGNVNLAILAEGDPILLNVYHAITVNPQKWPKVNSKGAQALSDFLVHPDTQKLIGAFGVEQYGQPLFVPDAHLTDADLGLDRE